MQKMKYSEKEEQRPRKELSQRRDDVKQGKVSAALASSVPRSDLELEQRHKLIRLASQQHDFWDGWKKAELATLAQWCKVFRFQKSSFLTRRGEAVDYFGVLLSGDLLLQIDNNIYAVLEAGQCLGVFGLLNFPGNHRHAFDAVGKQEGFILCLRYSELRLLGKYRPSILFRLYRSAALRALRTVTFQCFGVDLGRRISWQEPKPGHKELENLEKELQFFFPSFDKKDLKWLMGSLVARQFEAGELVVAAGTVCKFFMLNLSGQLYHLEPDGRRRLLPEKKLLFGEQFLAESTIWDPIYSSSKSTVLIMTEQQLEEVLAANSCYVQSIIEQITRHTLAKVKLGHERLTGIPFVQYSLDVDLRSRVAQEETDRGSRSTIFGNLSRLTGDSPVFLLDLYQRLRDLLKEEARLQLLKNEADKKEDELKEKERKKKKDDKKDIRKADKDKQKEREKDKKTAEQIQNATLLAKLRSTQVNLTPMMSLYQEKTEKGRVERKSKQETNKTSTLMGLAKRQSDFQDQLEELQGELNNLERENREIGRRIHEMQYGRRNFLAKIAELKEENMRIKSRVVMDSVVKEIKRKSLQATAEGLPFSSSSSAKGGSKAKSNSMGEVLAEQLRTSSKYRAVVKLAYRWLYLARKRKKQKKVGF